MAGDVRTEVAAYAETSLNKVKDLLLFLMFLAAVWAVYLSMVTGRGAQPPRPAAAEEELDGGEVNAMAPWPARALVDAKVWNIP